jgi:peptide/nickel transport system permease protein
LVTFIIRRLLQTVVVIFLVTLLSFLLLQLVPGDPIVAMLGGEASQEQIVEIQKELWLDRPVVVQYVHWLTDAFQGNFGKSIKLNEKVTEVIARTLPVTLYLSFISLILSPILGILLGLLASIKRGSVVDLHKFICQCRSGCTYFLLVS